MFVSKRGAIHKHSGGIPYPVYVAIGCPLSSGFGIIRSLRNDAVGRESSVDHSHDSSLGLLVIVVETGAEPVLKSRFQFGITHDDTQGIRTVFDRLQLVHRRLGRVAPVVDTQGALFSHFVAVTQIGCYVEYRALGYITVAVYQVDRLRTRRDGSHPDVVGIVGRHLLESDLCPM